MTDTAAPTLLETRIPGLQLWRRGKVRDVYDLGDHLLIVATDADAVVRRLLITDGRARDLEVQRAGLAEAFAELTQEAA